MFKKRGQLPPLISLQKSQLSDTRLKFITIAPESQSWICSSSQRSAAALVLRNNILKGYALKAWLSDSQQEKRNSRLSCLCERNGRSDKERPCLSAGQRGTSAAPPPSLQRVAAATATSSAHARCGPGRAGGRSAHADAARRPGSGNVPAAPSLLCHVRVAAAVSGFGKPLGLHRRDHAGARLPVFCH